MDERPVLERLRDPNYWIDEMSSDLYFLCRSILNTLEDPTPGYKDLYAPTHKRVCKFVEDYAYEGQELLILMPRHWIKSYIITVGWTIQRMFKNWTAGTHEHAIISNAVLPNSKQFLERIKYNIRYNRIVNGLFREFIPFDIENDATKWTQDDINLHGFQIETGSAEKTLVSQHYKIMINDDLVNEENSRNATQIRKVQDWWKLARSLLSPDGISINIGTRWNHDDLYGWLIKKFINPPKNYWKGKPIVELHKGNYHLLQMDCWADPDKETGSTFPNLYPEKKLKRIFFEMGDLAYGQYRNDPLARGKNPIKSEWFIRYQAEDLPSIRHTVMLVDPAGKATEEGSSSGMVCIHLCPDKKGYLEFGYQKAITDRELGEEIIDKAIATYPDMIGIEDFKFGPVQDIIEMLIPEMIRNGEIAKEHLEYAKTIPFILIEMKPRGRNKLTRIRNTSARIQDGSFVFPINGTEELEEQLVRFMTSTEIDIADAFSYILDYMHFPKKTDPHKVLELPPELKMTQEERIEKEWDEMREEADLSGQSSEFDDLY